MFPYTDFFIFSSPKAYLPNKKANKKNDCERLLGIVKAVKEKLASAGKTHFDFC